MLSELFLGSNKIGPDGCVAMADALKVNTTLVKLDLQVCVKFLCVLYFI